MALIRTGGGVAEIRGSIAGTVFSRGPAGAIARGRIKPINPATALQGIIRARFSALVQYWHVTLSVAERAAWNAYALATNFQNKLGDTIQIGGLACFVRLNSLMLQMGQAIVEAAPLSSGQGAQVACPVGATVATAKVEIGEPTGGFDKTDPLEFIAVYAGLPMSIGRTSSPRGYRYVGKIQGNAVPPVFAQSFDWPYPAVTGQHYPISVTHVDKENRVSAAAEYLANVIAA